MATSPNLDLIHLDANVASPQVILNESLDAMDEIVAGLFTHDIESDADYTLSTETDPQEWQYAAIKITDTGTELTTTRSIIVPDNTKQYIFINGTAQSLAVKTSGGTGVTVATNKTQLLFCDGTDVIAVAAAV